MFSSRETDGSIYSIWVKRDTRGKGIGREKRNVVKDF